MGDRALSIMDRVVAAQRGSAGSRVGSVPSIEEELLVGKAKSVTGGARVTSSVNERPVEETVTLAPRRRSRAGGRGGRGRLPGEDRRDHGHPGRGRGAQASPRGGRGVEFTRETEERQETVRDTVRRTEVEVEQVGAGVTRTWGPRSPRPDHAGPVPARIGVPRPRRPRRRRAGADRGAPAPCRAFVRCTTLVEALGWRAEGGAAGTRSPFSRGGGRGSAAGGGDAAPLGELGRGERS